MKNNAELISALNVISKQRGISVDILADAIESALVSAYKKNYNVNCNVRANLDRETGAIEIWASKTVVEQVENPFTEISIEKAKQINPLYEIGDVLEEEADTKNFGRIAAQTAKQVVMQRIREAEQGAIFEEYSDKEYEVLTAIVQRVEKNGVYVELGKTDGINLGVKACNRDLGALSGLTRNRLYLHDPALNFRYFKLKQPLYKAGMRP